MNKLSSQGSYLLFSPTQNGSLLKGELQITTDTSVVAGRYQLSNSQGLLGVERANRMPILKAGPFNLDRK